MEIMAVGTMNIKITGKRGGFLEEGQMEEAPAYGLWSLVIINSAIFIIFAFSFTKPKTKRDWRSFSAFSAFIIALFFEMYGFPSDDLFHLRLVGSAASGSSIRFLMMQDICGIRFSVGKFNPHFDPLHILSNVIIFGGFILLAAAWKVLYDAQKTHTLATTGPYSHVRHPQYDGFIPHYARLLISVADNRHSHHVSDFSGDVREACTSGRAGSSRGVRRRISPLHEYHPGIFPTAKRHMAEPGSLKRRWSP